MPNSETAAEYAGIGATFAWLRTDDGRSWIEGRPGAQLAFPWGAPTAPPGSLGL